MGERWRFARNHTKLLRPLRELRDAAIGGILGYLLLRGFASKATAMDEVIVVAAAMVGLAVLSPLADLGYAFVRAPLGIARARIAELEAQQQAVVHREPREAVLSYLGQRLHDGDHLRYRPEWSSVLGDGEWLELQKESARKWISETYDYIERELGHAHAALFHSDYGLPQHLDGPAGFSSTELQTLDDVHKNVARRCIRLTEIIKQIQSRPESDR